MLLMAGLVYRATRPPEVGVARAHAGALRYSLAASGVVEGDSADLGFQGSGRIVHLYAREGDAISRSQLLARQSPLPATPGTLGASDVIQAPYDGRVVTVYQREGAVVSPGQPVVRVISDGPPWVTAFIESEDAIHLSPGATLRCSTGGYLGQSWELRVVRVGGQAVERPDLPGSTRQVRVRCDVAAGAFPLPPGTEVDVDGDVTLSPHALLIPSAAVTRQGASDQVWRVRDGRISRTPVSIGANNFQDVQVTAGLSEGDLVVVQAPSATEGLASLRDGQRVRVRMLPPAAEPAGAGERG